MIEWNWSTGVDQLELTTTTEFDVVGKFNKMSIYLICFIWLNEISSLFFFVGKAI